MGQKEAAERYIKIMQEVKDRYTVDFMNSITERDKQGSGYICPFCGSGKGKHGTGIKAGTENSRFFTCFNCGFKGDMFDFIKALYHCQTLKEQIEKAEEILHRQFLDKNNGMQYQRETPKQAERENKNKGETMVNKAENKTLLERAKEAAERQEQERRNRDYIKASGAKLPGASDGLEYLKRRGISETTAYNYNLGYTEKYYFGETATPAIIIPKYVPGKGLTSYVARSTANIKDKVRKNKGEQGIFNLLALRKPETVTFLVEGEFDALSVIEAGFVAICTGGETDTGKLVELIKESKTHPELYVILPDNDRLPSGQPDEMKGYNKGLKLLEALKAAGVNVTMIDTRQWNPEIKDANDYLVKDRAGFRELLRGIVEPVKQKALQGLGRVTDSIQPFFDHIMGKSSPISTGFDCLDEILDRGLRPCLIMLGAISSLGKTSLALNIADNVAESGKDVVFFSLEMSRYELMAKSISRKTFLYCRAQKLPTSYAKSNIGITDFDRYDRYSMAELDIIDKSKESYQHGIGDNLYIVEGVGNIGTAEIREHIRRHISITGNTPVCVIDYLQILAPEDPRSSDKQAVDRNITELKRISRDYNIPMIVISSFNRESYWQPVSMSSFKESGGIEFSADILIALQYKGMDYEKYTEGNATKFESEKDKHRAQRLITLKETIEAETNSGGKVDIDIKILKYRSGRKCKTVIQYYPRFNCFIEENKKR